MNLTSSMEETISTTINFICELQFKDTVKGDAAETQISASNAAAYLSACLRSDNLSEVERDKIISSYVELNPYYKDLEDRFGIEPYVSRLAKDMDIIYQPEQKVVSHPHLYQYRTVYKECLQSFYITSYSQAMVSKNNYRNYCLLTINIMAFVNLMHKWLETPFDINLMNGFQIDRFMYSFGITYFRTLPLKYKQLIARNLNRLISNKGTDKVVIDILEIFSFKDIEVQKYYLARQSTVSDIELGETNSLINKEMDVQFLSHNIKIPSLNVAIKNNDYRKYTYENITSVDPHWQVSKSEVLALDFDYIQTKYFSIETGFELGAETTNTVLILNLLRRIREDFPNREALQINSSIISDTDSAALEDIVLTLHILTCEYQGIVDEIHYDLEGIAGVYNFAKYDLPAMNQELFADNPDAIVDISNIALTDLRRIGVFDINVTSDIYENNLKVKNNMEKYLLAETNYQKYKRLKNAYNAKFVQKLSYELFHGSATYTDYLRTRNLNLAEIVDQIRNIESPIEKNERIEETISNLTDVVNGALDKFGIFLGTTSLNIIVGYLKRVISAFKSFTVTLKDLNVFVVMREQYDTKLLDELKSISALLLDTSQINGDDTLKAVAHFKLETMALMLDHSKVTSALPVYDRYEGFSDEIKRITSKLDLIADTTLRDKIERILVSMVINTDTASLINSLTLTSEYFLKSIIELRDSDLDITAKRDLLTNIFNEDSLFITTLLNTKDLGNDQKDVFLSLDELKLEFLASLNIESFNEVLEEIFITAYGLSHTDFINNSDSFSVTTILHVNDINLSLSSMRDHITDIRAAIQLHTTADLSEKVVVTSEFEKMHYFETYDKLGVKTKLRNFLKPVEGQASLGFESKERIAVIDTFKIHTTT